jgi:uncharacterized membrane protein YhaH (DUF805 family)
MRPIKVDFLTAIQRGFRGFVDFRGAATRSEFWYWTLFIVLFGMVLGVIESAIWPPLLAGGESLEDVLLALTEQTTPLTTAASLVFFLPSLAISARRFHDAGFSAKWLLLILVPVVVGFIGAVVLASAAAGISLGSANLMAAEVLTSVLLFMGLLLIIVIGIQIFFFVLCLLPSRPASSGNKYVKPEWESYAETPTTV